MALYTHNGTEYTSLRQACIATGANYYTVRRRVHDHGWSLSDAIAAPIYARKPLGGAEGAVARIDVLIKTHEHDHALVIAIGQAVREYLMEVRNG